MKNKHLIPDDGVEIAWLGGSWHLYHRPSRSTDEWMNLKLVDVDSWRQWGHIRTFHLSWNGERFAKNSDYERLVNRMPELHEAVEKVMALAERQRKAERNATEKRKRLHALIFKNGPA